MEGSMRLRGGVGQDGSDEPDEHDPMSDMSGEEGAEGEENYEGGDDSEVDDADQVRSAMGAQGARHLSRRATERADPFGPVLCGYLSELYTSVRHQGLDQGFKHMDIPVDRIRNTHSNTKD
jgi:hypothetical protein